MGRKWFGVTVESELALPAYTKDFELPGFSSVQEVSDDRDCGFTAS